MRRRSLFVFGLLGFACGVNPTFSSGGSFGFSSGGGFATSSSDAAAEGCAVGEPTPGCECFAGERFACSCGNTLTCPATEVWQSGCDCPAPMQQPSLDDGGQSCALPSPDVGCLGDMVVGPLGCCVAVGSPCSFAPVVDGGACPTGQLLLGTPCDLDGLRECAPCSALVVPNGDGGTVSLFVVSDSGSCPPDLVASNGCCAPASWLDAGPFMDDAGDTGDAGGGVDASPDARDAAADVTRP